MKKIVLLTSILSVFILSAFTQEKPNILFIMTDQQSYNMMSCAGNEWLNTPNIDKLSETGYRFDITYCANPVCMPSRFSLLTGHFASDVGVKENTNNSYDALKVEQIIAKGSIGYIFREAGYETLYSGKTHLYGTKDVSEYGFTIHGLDPYDGPSIYAEKALQEIGNGSQEKPFFMFLSYLNPHDICYKAGMDDRFPDGLTPAKAAETARLLEMQKNLSEAEYRSQIPPRMTNLAPMDGELPEMVEMGSLSRDWDEASWDIYSWMYYRLTESVDAQIGRVLTALKNSGLEENTIVVFTSDHGEMNGAHGLILKNKMFEEAQRVPFIFSGKGIKANYVDTSTLVCNGTDLLPTLCDMANIDIPEGIPGISLKPFLVDKGQKPDRKYLITENYNAYQITDKRYKYTIYELPGLPETLTDLKINPGETINYATDSSYAEIKAVLKKELMANLSERGLTPLPEDRTIKNIRAIDKKNREIRRSN